MTAQFYDLNIETLEDGTIRLEQRDYSGEAAIIDLHPAQAAFIADGLPANASERNQAQPNGTAERIATLERRLCWMRDRFGECYSALPPDMYERCADAPEFDSWLTASVDVSTEFCADIAGAPIGSHAKSLSSPLGAASGLSSDGCLPGAVGCNSEHSELRLS